MPAQQPGAMQRRHSSASSSSSSSSEAGAGLHSRQTSQENISLIPTRTTKVATSKPAANPLQFVKVGPCVLYRSAQEQIKKVEEVKKVKQELRDEAEDWQSNLDNWKCSRRKRQEHIIERVVEVKKLELEEYDRNRRRSKTFNEMLEERTTKGRKTSLPVYNDDNNDLSDLGISKGVSNDDVFQDKQNGEDLEKKFDTDKSLICTKENGSGMNGYSAADGKCNVTNETEEYTYERAIQSYVNFTESRVRGRSLTPSEDTKISNGYSKQVPPVPAKPRRGSCKIEEKLSELEQLKKRSVSTTDLSINDSVKKPIVVPKVDILKRRELFEKNSDEQSSKINNRLSGDFSSSRSIRERLSSLEKQAEESVYVKKANRLSAEISVRDRLSNIEKYKSADNVTSTSKVNRLSNDEITSSQSVKDRLSSLQKVSSNDNLNKNVSQNRLSSEVTSIKERLSSLDAACGNEVLQPGNNEQVTVDAKGDSCTKQEQKLLKTEDSFERAFSPEEEIYESKRQQHFRHRSLDSLDVDTTEGLVNESFERVQSLEDLDFCRNYPASSLSGDTDREDSGIHTADVSSSVSQADDCDLHLDSEVDIKLHHHPTITEEITKNSTQVIKFDVCNKEIDIQSEPINVSLIPVVESIEVAELSVCKTEMVVDTPNSFLKLPLKLESSLNDPLPVIPESPSEPFPAFNIDEINEKTFKNEMDTKTQNTPFDNSSSHDTVETQINANESKLEELNKQKCEVENDSSSVAIHNSNNALAYDNNSAYNNTVNISDLMNSPARDVVPENALSLTAVTMDVVEVCMQEKTSCGRGNPVVEICHKIDSSELSSPLPTPVIEVDTQYKFDTHQKAENIAEMSQKMFEVHTELQRKEAICVKDEVVTQFEALTVDVGKTDDDNNTTVTDLINTGKDMLLTVETQCFDKENITNNTVFPDYKATYFLNKNELCLSDNGEVVFPLSPTTLEPPKEKPPPPPTETSDDDDVAENKSSSLRRLDSTKRIKKEIRQKRSSFLGIEGLNDDSYLEPELELVRPPPDMTTLLAEERRLEQMMYRQSICSESDSNQESRDSGVELEKHHDDLTWSRVNHSRDNSETFGNTSTTSEEEEIVKKEREIIEILEQEELRRYATSTQTEQDNIGEKLALRLRELEQEKSRLEWEREEEMLRRKAEAEARSQHESRIQAREQELRKQESIVGSTDVEEEATTENDHQQITGELLMSERERLGQEQVALQRQRESLMQQQWTSSLQDFSAQPQKTVLQEYHHSVQDTNEEPVSNYRRSLNDVAEVPGSEYRRSMPDLATTQQRRPPPPIPPAKPLIIPRTQEKRTSSPQQMSRQTLQALSAAPRSRLIANDNWMQTKRKAKPTQDNYNYQHWLIQEAEHRRITEQQQRQATPPRRPVPPPSQHSQSGAWPQGASSQQYINWQPQQQGGQWGVPATQPRSDKPLPDSIIQTLTQRVQNRINSDANNNRRRAEQSPAVESRPQVTSETQEKMLSVSGKKKCSHCSEELGRGAAMIIESLRLFYHINCFKCCVCCVQLGDGLMGTDVRVRNNKLHCHNCYSSDDGVKFSCV